MNNDLIHEAVSSIPAGPMCVIRCVLGTCLLIPGSGRECPPRPPPAPHTHTAGAPGAGNRGTSSRENSEPPQELVPAPRRLLVKAQSQWMLQPWFSLKLQSQDQSRLRPQLSFHLGSQKEPPHRRQLRSQSRPSSCSHPSSRARTATCAGSRSRSTRGSNNGSHHPTYSLGASVSLYVAWILLRGRIQADLYFSLLVGNRLLSSLAERCGQGTRKAGDP